MTGDTAAALPFSVTAERFDDIPAALAALVDTIVHVPPLRERSDDVMPLAAHAAATVRGRPVTFTPAAERALTGHDWPGNTAQLVAVVKEAVRRADVVDVRHLPPEVLTAGSHRLSRIESFERDEIIRMVSQPLTSMKDAAAQLGMSRATLYRKIAQYDIRVPRERRAGRAG